MCELDFLSIYPAGTLEVQKGHPRLKGMWGQEAGPGSQEYRGCFWPTPYLVYEYLLLLLL